MIHVLLAEVEVSKSDDITVTQDQDDGFSRDEPKHKCSRSVFGHCVCVCVF